RLIERGPRRRRGPSRCGRESRASFLPFCFFMTLSEFYMFKKTVLLAVCGLTSLVSAQAWTTVPPGTFVDISTTGGTAITGVGDDTSHPTTTTIGNSLFPAGPVVIGSNGAAIAGLTGTPFVTYVNSCLTTYAATGQPAGATVALFPFWDDLMALAA